MATASTGYLPTAVSPESITASAPSKTALATSETSARVGVGFSVMVSSIWVATMQALPARSARLTRRFCVRGTSASGISTPRSPRATSSASATPRMASIFLSACGFSILAMIRAVLPPASRICRNATISERRRTKESAT
jgi:hypothetical protein